MAKKQPSLGKIIHSVKSENLDHSKRITELEKDIKSLETTALAIMEILKRNGLTKVKKEEKMKKK